MKKGSFSLLLVLLLSVIVSPFALAASNLEEGVGQLAQQISKSMEEKQKQKIAITDFSDLNGNVTALGQFMAEELTTQLFMVAPGKFEVVERRQLLKLEEELTLGQTGFIEEKSIKKMGQILGVDAIVTGSMTDLGNTVKINARLIGVESAKVFAVAATDIPKTGMVADLIAKQVEKKQTSAKEPVQSSSQTTQQAKAVGKKTSTFEEKTAQNSDVRLIVKGIEKKDKNIVLLVVVENISESVRSFQISSNDTYLYDNEGERWSIKGDSKNLTGKWYELPPKGIVKTQINFEATGGIEGNVFVFKGTVAGGGLHFVIQDIRL